MNSSPILAMVILIARIFIIIKISILFYQTSVYPEQYNVSSLTWWIYLLIFDIWILAQIPVPEDNSDKNE